MKHGYVTTFFPFQYALMILVEYVCRDGHRITCRTETIDWQDSRMVWQ
jgi:hypothetical protein